MQIKEMHIEVRQATQSIAANLRRKFQDQEIDWILNKALERFVQSKVKPKDDGQGGYQVDQLDVDSIRTLIKVRNLDAAYDANAKEYSAFLPSDYDYLLSDTSRVLLLCAGVTAPSLTTKNETVLKLPFSTTTKGAAPFYQAISITLGVVNVTLTEIKNFYQSTEYNGLQSKPEIFTMVDTILWYLRNVKGIEVYWENYRSIFAPATFLFPGVSAGSIVVDAGTSVPGSTTSVSYQYYNDTQGTWRENRLMGSSKVRTVLTTPFMKSDYRSPVSELSGHYVVVHGDPRFIVTQIGVEYVKKPRRMDVLLRQNCELPEGFHRTICDLAVEYIKALISDPNWEVKLRDNMQRSVTTNP